MKVFILMKHGVSRMVRPLYGELAEHEIISLQWQNHKYRICIYWPTLYKFY